MILIQRDAKHFLFYIQSKVISIIQKHKNEKTIESIKTINKDEKG